MHICKVTYFVNYRPTVVFMRNDIFKIKPCVLAEQKLHPNVLDAAIKNTGKVEDSNEGQTRRSNFTET